MHRCARAASFVGFALLLSACGRACDKGDRQSFVLGETKYESIDGKVKVELVRTVEHTNASAIRPNQFTLRVHTQPVIDYRIGCERVDMAENAAGTLVAFRCKGKSNWDVLRLRGGDRYLYDCNAPVGTGPAPEFDKLDSLSAGANRIMGCLYSDTGLWAELVRSVAEDEGLAGGARFLVKIAEQPHHETDVWDRALEAQSKELQDVALQALCPAVLRGDAPMALYVRAVERCSLDGPKVGEAAVAQLQSLLKEVPKDPSADAGSHWEQGNVQRSKDLALNWAAAIATDKAREAAGKAACAALSQAPASAGVADVSPIALDVLAATKTKCAGAERFVKAPVCLEAIDCEGHLCTQPELQHFFDVWTASAHGALVKGKRSSIDKPYYVRALLALKYAQGPLDHATALANARRHYAWAAPKNKRACFEEMPTGTSCDCAAYMYRDDLCSLPESATRGTSGPCDFVIDDAKMELRDAVRSCAAAGESCAENRRPCCSGKCVSGKDDKLHCL